MNGNKMITGRGKNWIVAMLLCVGAIAILGCEQQSPEIKISTESGKPLPKGEESDAFLDRISSRETVSETDAMRGILMLVDGQDNATSFAERSRLLAEKKILSRNWSFQAERPLTKGKFAYMIYQACEMGGGVILTITGPSQRYCLRELQYQEMMSSAGSFYSPVSGMEFVAVLGRADLYKRTGKIPSKSGDTEKD